MRGMRTAGMGKDVSAPSRRNSEKVFSCAWFCKSMRCHRSTPIPSMTANSARFLLRHLFPEGEEGLELSALRRLDAGVFLSSTRWLFSSSRGGGMGSARKPLDDEKSHLV